MTKRTTATPIRRALREESPLLANVQNGLGAVKPTHRDYFHTSVRAAFADSLDTDEALRITHEQENRWDYLLGHAASGEVVAVEPHSAKSDEVRTVIRKRQAAQDQLRAHLRDGAKVAKWLWVASGKVQFANTEKIRFQLDSNGIEFADRQILAKHLPAAPTPNAQKAGTKRNGRSRR